MPELLTRAVCSGLQDYSATPLRLVVCCESLGIAQWIKALLRGTAPTQSAEIRSLGLSADAEPPQNCRSQQEAAA